MTENIKSYVDLLKRLAPEAERLVLDSRKVKERYEINPFLSSSWVRPRSFR